jgi:hypothetical protein
MAEVRGVGPDPAGPDRPGASGTTPSRAGCLGLWRRRDPATAEPCLPSASGAAPDRIGGQGTVAKTVERMAIDGDEGREAAWAGAHLFHH